MGEQALKKILYVEDEPILSEVLADYLKAAGFEVSLSYEGTGVVSAVKQNPPDLLLLDLMLPGKDGIDICKEIRSFSDLPIIMVTARVEEIDRLIGLELGADDYICKPYSPREVLARVKAVLRRSHGRPPKDTATQGLYLDETRYLARLFNTSLDLTPVEFRLLKILSDNPGRIFSRDQLINRIYMDHRVVTDRTVDTHIKNLRKKMKPLCPEGDIIQSIYGVGYKLEMEALSGS